MATLALLTAGPAAAQTWTGATSNDWTDASNWDNSAVPTGAAGVIIGAGANPTVLGVNGAVAGVTNGLLLSGTTGSLTIQNGSTLSSAGPAAIGSGVGSIGVVTVTGAGSHWTASAQLTVGGTGQGTLNIEAGGAVTALAGLRLGFSASGSGILNVVGGGVVETTQLLRGAGAAQVTFDNATLRALAGGATFINGLAVDDLEIAAGGLTIDTNGYSIGGPGFSCAGSLAVTGTGTLTLTEASTYGGDTLVGSASTLALTGAGAIASTRVFADGTFDVSGITAGGIDVPYLAGSGTVVLGSKSLTVDEIAPGGDGFGTLTIDGDYVGTDTLLRIQTALGDDSSETDRLVVTGATDGTTNVLVTNLGGVGGVTADGIRIVEVGGASNGTFNLLGDVEVNGEQAVIGGAYLYGLYQGTPSVADGSWYLRNIIDPDDDTPIFQPAAPVIEAYVAAALQAFNTSESLAQRLGSRTGGEDGDGLWGRFEASRLSMAPGSSTTGAGYDVTTWRLQAGLDRELGQVGDGSLVGGVNVQVGAISAAISSPSGLGGVESTGYGLGATLTWYGKDGFYLDAQGKLTWFDSALNSETLATTIVSGNGGFGYALSLEAGRQLALGDGWSVTPQAQLSYSAVDFDSFVDPFGSTVLLESGDSLLGRLGLSVEHETEWRDTAGEAGNTRIYGIANLSYEFLDGTSTSVGGDTLNSKPDPLWAGVGFGGALDWAGERLSLHGEASVNTSLDSPGDSYSLGATAGIRGKF